MHTTQGKIICDSEFYTSKFILGKDSFTAQQLDSTTFATDY